MSILRQIARQMHQHTPTYPLTTAQVYQKVLKLEMQIRKLEEKIREQQQHQQQQQQK